ncbi:MAG: glycogen/starch/alpha-glucan phosphorylase, partial [Acidobacteriota bacterium]|nr:glycogen/starch/alpha-glucan phosphorylase [Acidobacteriota bacterium]
MHPDDPRTVELHERIRRGLGEPPTDLDVPSRSGHVVAVEDDRTGVDVDTLQRAFLDNLYYVQGSTGWNASRHDFYMALAHTLRDRLMHRWIRSIDTLVASQAKVVCYLSAEFLMGRQLENCLHNLDLWQSVHRALTGLGLKLHDIVEAEPEPGLGNGGLGRLGACFLDSLATLDIPAFGYGIRYEFGVFEQRFENGWQIERPDKWLRLGNPWEIERPYCSFQVKFGGRTVPGLDEHGRFTVNWIPAETVIGTAYDTLVPGYGTNLINTLRLWSASSSNDFDFEVFEAGDYTRAVAAKTASENISKVLYPNDNTEHGRELRLKQQYFFVSCSLQDILRMQHLAHGSLDALDERCAIQLNDTHPSI